MEKYRVDIYLLVLFDVRQANLEHLLYHCIFSLDKFHKYIVYFLSSELCLYFNVSEIVLSGTFLLVL